MSDEAELKKALKAFRKRLKILRQDDESTLGRGAFSGGKVSCVAGIRPPPDFPPEVWEELADAGKLKREPAGTYSLPPSP